MHDLRHHGQRPHGARADPRHQQQVGEVPRTAIGCGSEGSVQPALDHVIRSDIVMAGQHKVRQKCLLLWCGNGRRPFDAGQFAHNAIRLQVIQHKKLPFA